MISRIFRSVFFTTILVLILGLGASLFISSYQLIKADSDGLISFTTKLEDALNKNPSMDLTLSTGMGTVFPFASIKMDRFILILRLMLLL